VFLRKIVGRIQNSPTFRGVFHRQVNWKTALWEKGSPVLKQNETERGIKKEKELLLFQSNFFIFLIISHFPRSEIEIIIFLKKLISFLQNLTK
jgi:hypothetical protein